MLGMGWKWGFGMGKEWGFGMRGNGGGNEGSRGLLVHLLTKPPTRLDTPSHRFTTAVEAHSKGPKD